jgi:hypothetical protein
MQNSTYNYQSNLENYIDCPPKSYEPMKKYAIRWVFTENIANSFLPLNIIKYPPKAFSQEDLMCKSFGLSLFDTIENAKTMFKKLYQNKRGLSHQDFITEKGNALAIVSLDITLGIGGDLNDKTGHFTFHEYEGIRL